MTWFHLFTLATGTALFFLTFACLSRRLARDEGYYGLLFFFAISAFFYVILIPWQLYIYDNDQIMLAAFSIPIGVGFFALLFFTLLQSIAGFYAGYRLAGGRGGIAFRSGAQPPPASASSPIVWGLASVFVVSLVALLCAWHMYDISTYTRVWEVAAEHVGFPLAYTNMSAAGGLLIPYLYLRKGRAGKWLAALVFAVLGAMSVLCFIKLPIVTGALAVCYLITRAHGQRWWISLPFFIGSLATIPLIIVYTAIRARIGSVERFIEAVSWHLHHINLMGYEQGGPFFTLAHTLQNTDQLSYGMGYLRSLTTLVPRFIWPSRPPSVAEQFCIDHLAPPYCFTFTPIGEAYSNFGLLGPLLHFFLFGALVVGMIRILHALVRRYALDPLLGDITVKVIGFLLMIIFFRGFFTGWLKMTLITLAPSLLMIIAFSLWEHRRHVRHRRGH